MYIETTTSRLELRPLHATDVAFILALVNSPGWLRYIGDRGVRDDVAAAAYIRQVLGNVHTFYHVIALREISLPVGVVSLIQRDKYPFPDLGFALLPEHEKKGYAHEACRAYLDTISGKGVYENIMAITLPHNEASINLLEKLGFRYERENTEGTECLSVYSINLPR